MELLPDLYLIDLLHCFPYIYLCAFHAVIIITKPNAMKHFAHGFLSTAILRGTMKLGITFGLIFLTQQVTFSQFESGFFEFDGNTRDYKVFLPDNYSSSTKFPLVFNLHPLLYGAQWELSYTRMHLVADTLGFIVVYPNAVIEWNVGAKNNDGTLKYDIDDVGFFNALIDVLDNEYSIDLERIYACGFSNGAFMSLRLACELSHRIAAVASVGGAILKVNVANCLPVRTLPLLLIHGTEDLDVPFGGNSSINSTDWTVEYWSGLNNCMEENTTTLEDLDPADGCTIERISYTSCDFNCNVMFYKVNGGGHTWPGGNIEKYSNGNTSLDMNASYEILKFFNEAQLTPASVENHELEGIISIYPNPTSSLLNIRAKQPGMYNVEISSLNGQLVLHKELEGTSHQLDISSFQKGVYFISISSKDFVNTRKIVKL